MTDEARLLLAPLAALVAAFLATPLAIAVARRTAFFDHPTGYKTHGVPTPYLGGTAVMVGFLVGALGFGGGTERYAPIIVGALVLWVVGTIDDRRTVPPAHRLVVTSIVATLVWATDLGWSLSGSEPVNLALTIAWTIGLVNAFNLMDNMDGAASTVTSASMSGIAIVALLEGNAVLAALVLALAGACVGFLRYNLSTPARIFLGDGGSMAIGFVAAASIMAVAPAGELGWPVVLPAALLVGLPVFDTVLVIVSRYRRGVTIWTGGRDHVTYRLLARVGSTRAVAFAVGLLQAGLCGLAIALVELDTATSVAMMLPFVALAAVALAILETPSWRPDWNGRLEPSAARDAVADAVDDRVRVLRIITRMNMGGPAHHVTVLSSQLDPSRYETLLVTGNVGRGEASLADLAVQSGARVHLLTTLGPQIRPLADFRALIALSRIVRTFRPHVVHTHTAKAGLLGRVAALTARGGRPVVVHTYHGHVLERYFGPLTTRYYRTLERVLARVTDCLVGVSQATVDDLVRLRIAPAERFRVIPVGLELDPFLTTGAGERQAFRGEIHVDPDDVLLLNVGRLVAIKRVDVVLRAFARASEQYPRIRLAVVGDGPLRPELERLAAELGVAPTVRFLGYRTDLARVTSGADIAVLASDSEGTPVFLIEAAAGARPAIATAVGGVPDVVNDGGGILVPAGDEATFADAVVALASDPEGRRAMGEAARSHVAGRFRSSRLVVDVDLLYDELLRGRSSSIARNRSRQKARERATSAA